MVKVYVKLQYTRSIQVYIVPIVKMQLQGLPSVQRAVNTRFLSRYAASLWSRGTTVPVTPNPRGIAIATQVFLRVTS